MTQQPTPAPQTARKPRAAGTAIMWTTAAIGGALILGVGASAAYGVATSRASASAAGNLQVTVDGLTELDLDISAADFTLDYGPVTEATLEVAGAAHTQWGLRRDGSALVVTSPRGSGGSCWIGFCPPERRVNSTVTLTLPQSFAERGLDADVSVGVGRFRADGTFGNVGLEIGAGKATLTGAARDLDVTVGLGSFVGELTGVTTADFEVAMGELTTSLRGDAPEYVGIEVGMGSATLELPDEEYRFETSHELGELRNSLRSNPSSPYRIAAEVSIGDLVLRPVT